MKQILKFWKGYLKQTFFLEIWLEQLHIMKNYQILLPIPLTIGPNFWAVLITIKIYSKINILIIAKSLIKFQNHQAP